MSDIVEQARRMLEGTTPGDWKFYDAYDIIDRPGMVGTRRMGTNEDTVIEASRYGYDELNVSETDAAFITWAKSEGVPALCAEVERLRGQVAELCQLAEGQSQSIDTMKSTIISLNGKAYEANARAERAEAALVAANEDAARLYVWANDGNNHSWRCRRGRMRYEPCVCGLNADLQAHRDRVEVK